MAYTPAAPLNRYALKRQSPLTQGAQLAEDQNTQGLQTGNFADVQSAQKATQRANAARSSQALQAARGTVARSGGDFSPQAAIRAQDIAFAGANAQNLDASNQTNQLQRQYRQDALNRSDAYEQNAQNAAIGERNYQSNIDAANLAQKNQEVGFGFTDRQLGQTDTAQKNEMDRYNLSRGDQNRQFDVTTGLNQQQINNQNAQFDKTLGQRQNEFGVTSGQTQQQINNQASQFDKNYGLDASRVDQSQQQINNQANQFNQTISQRDREFGVTSGQTQQQINNQVDQFGQTLGQRQSEFGVTSAQADRQLGQTDTAQANEMTRYNLTRGDQNNQFDQTLGQRQNEFNVTSDQNQQQINNQVSQFDKNYGLDSTRVDQSQQQINNQANQYNLSRGDQNEQFAVTSGQAQQQITNQATQAAAQLGYNYASLSQQDQQFFQDLAQRQSEFSTTSAQTDRQLGQTDTAMQNEMDRYALTRGDALDQNAVQNAQQDRLIGVQETRLTADTTDAQYQKTMDAISSIADPKAQSAAMAAYLRGDDVSQFISGTLYGSDGSLNKDFASASPAEQQYQATIDELKFTYPGKTDAEYQDMAVQRLQQADKLLTAPLVGTTPGTTGSSSTTGTSGGPLPGSNLAIENAQASLDDIYDTLPSTVNQDNVRTIVAQFGSSKIGAAAKLTGLSDYDSENSYAKTLWKSPGGRSNIEIMPPSNESTATIIPRTQQGADYIPFALLIQSGVTDKQAFDIASQAIGVDRMKAAYKAITGKDWA